MRFTCQKKMEIKKIDIETIQPETGPQRPESFSTFVGQTPIKAVLETAIDSAQKRA